MKEYKKQLVNRHAVLLAASVFLLAACGGGGSSSGSGSAPGTASLSDAQKNYESFALASNGGLHYLDANITFTTTSTDSVSISADSSFFSEDSSLPRSPVNGAQPLTETLTSLASTLKAPASVQDRFVVNGAIYSGGLPGQARVSYAGPNVQIDYLASDGNTVVRTLLGTSYDVVQLSGLISASPSELFTNSAIGTLTNTLNGQPLYNQQANWESGSAYVKVVRHVVGDELYTYDCAAPATTDNNPTSCTATISTLESFFPYASTADGKTYLLADGQIVTLAGVRAWVSNTPLNAPSTQYRAYFQYNGGIYAGYVLKDGTTLQIAPRGGGAPQDNYYVLNNAAAQSIKSAINF